MKFLIEGHLWGPSRVRINLVRAARVGVVHNFKDLVFLLNKIVETRYQKVNPVGSNCFKVLKICETDEQMKWQKPILFKVEDRNY